MNRDGSKAFHRAAGSAESRMKYFDKSPVIARALPWLLLLYCAASLLHFVHNAEHVADYPNLPEWISRGSIYGAWLAIFSVGLLGYLLYRGRHTSLGLLLLAIYTALGFDGLLHYGRAPLAAHSTGMNATIWIEVVSAAMAFGAVAWLAVKGHRGPESISPARRPK